MDNWEMLEMSYKPIYKHILTVIYFHLEIISFTFSIHGNT